MHDGVFVLVEGRMKVLRRTSSSEDGLLPMLLDQHPEIIAAALGTDEQRQLLLVRRRVGLNGATQAAAEGLYVDAEGMPILVGVQQSADGSSDGEVLSRMLDSLASGTSHWRGWCMREVFALTHVGRDDGRLLAETLGWTGDPDAFWARVESHLAAHRVRLVLVTDRLSEAMLRVIEMLNRQMRDVEVYGVEVSPYGSGATRAFVPRVMGRPSTAIEAHQDALPRPVFEDSGRHRLRSQEWSEVG